MQPLVLKKIMIGYSLKCGSVEIQKPLSSLSFHTEHLQAENLSNKTEMVLEKVFKRTKYDQIIIEQNSK